MLQALANWLFDPAGLTPHGFCLLWDPGLIWTYTLSDIGIGIAYFMIPFALATVARRRKDLVFRPLFYLFAAFILLCGTTHFLDVAALWLPIYGLQAVVKAATAVVSIGTAVTLLRLLPQAMLLPSPLQLRAAYQALHEAREHLHQSQKMEAVGQLTGGIAHDINNMLQGISGSLELLELRVGQNRLTELDTYIKAARRATGSAASLTQRMLAFARRQTLSPQVIEPDSLVKDLSELLRRSLTPAVELVLDLHDGQWLAHCDRNQLESTLLNLAINARDAMPRGGRLTISTAERRLSHNDLKNESDVEPGDYIEIVVADNGQGMPPEVMERAFEPFFTTKPVGQGTGLGLSQVYGFVRQSGGFVRLESAANEGTTVRLYLPRQSDARVAEEAKPNAATATGRSAGVVLLVDDEHAVRGIMAEVLRDEGFTVLEAEDGPFALRLIQSSVAIDLLLTDVGLPGLNGRQLAEAARQARPGLPVILITGYAGSALRDESLPPGAELVQKPVSVIDLAERVTDLLARNKAEAPC